MKVNLAEVSETLLITLNARAKDFQSKKSVLRDRKSYEIAQKLDYDFTKFDLAWKSYYGILARAKTMDEEILKFIQKNPNATIVSIGCGLDSRFYRVDNGKITWYNLDLEEVIELRKSLFPKEQRVYNLSRSLLDERWTKEISIGEESELLIVSEGVLMYFSEEEIRKFLKILTDNFPKFTAHFDFIYKGLVGKEKYHDTMKNMKAEFKWGVKDGREVEILSEGIQQIDYINFTDTLKKIIPIFKRIYVPLMYIFNNRMGIYEYNKIKNDK